MAGHKSHASRNRLKALVAEGKFPQSEFDALDQNSNIDKLPERAGRNQSGSTRLPKQPGSRYDRAAKARLY